MGHLTPKGSAGAKMHSVIILEDKLEILSRLQTAVNETEGLCVVGTATHLSDGLDLIYDKKPRVVLVDLGLPDGSGIEAIRAAAQADWPIDTLVISIFGDEARVVEAIRAGAKGYILKGGPIDQVGADIHAILKGGSPISPSIARHLLGIVTREYHTAEIEMGKCPLSEREMEILNAVSRGYKRREIAQKLSISEGTVGNHINSIYRKLGVASNLQAVATATRMGLL
jgi:DNA-binding NarL/FixJ family response regulator